MDGHASALHHHVRGLYDAHHGYLLAWLRRKLDNSNDAADIAHDTFLRMWIRHRDGLPFAVDEPRAYLTTIAKRLVVNHYQRRTLEQAYLETLAVLPANVAPSPERRALVLETLLELDALLDALPRMARTAFLMSQLEGLPYQHIADHLGISVRTVTRHVTLGFRQCLRVMLCVDSSEW